MCRNSLHHFQDEPASRMPQDDERLVIKGGLIAGVIDPCLQTCRIY